MMRGATLKAAHQNPAARKVVDAGLAYFGKAEDAWPDAVRFYGETQGWDEAKRRAADCGKQFRRVSARCSAAAVSPAEQAAAERKDKAKADNLFERVLKKK